MSKQGLFVGLITLDLIYLTTGLPDRNQKTVAIDHTVAAGGPATNAAVTFSHLGNASLLLGSLGKHPLSALVIADLQQCRVKSIDLTIDRTDPLPTSSIIVTQATGDRAVVSLNAVQSQAPVTAIPSDILQGIEIVLLDGHQMAVSQAIAQQAKAQQIPVVIDGGSWKPGFAEVLPYAEYVICSANFRPPGCHTIAEVFAYLDALSIPHIAMTQGGDAILFQSQERSGQISLPAISAIDTLGAGDIFHGAFCHFIQQHDFESALTQAAEIASFSCQFFGTRSWMTAN